MFFKAIATILFLACNSMASAVTPQLHYFISVPEPETHCYEIELHISE